MALSPDKNLRGHFHGTPACLSALFDAERYQEIVDVLAGESFWPYRRWAVRALVAMGKRDQALSLAEESRTPWSGGGIGIDRMCEEILLEQGRVDDAYERYAIAANRAGTYLATFRAVKKKYPNKTPAQILHDLGASTPGEEGKCKGAHPRHCWR